VEETIMRRAWWWILGGALFFVTTSRAQAQVNAQRATPVASDTFFVTPDAGLAREPLSGGASLSIDYGRLPLELRTPAGDEPVISDLTTADLVVHLSVLRRIRLEAALPFNSSAAAGPQSFAGTGDARLSLQATLVDPGHHPIGLALRPFLVLPTGDADRYLSDGALSPGGMLVVHRQGERLELAVAAGVRWLPPSADGSARRDQLLGSLGLSFALDPRFRLGAELFGATQLEAPFAHAAQSPLEALGTVHATVRRGLVVALGAGTALTEGVGGPRFRGLFQVAGTFPTGERDRDGDGIADRIDGCPDSAEDRDGFQDADGCPDPDNDGDGLADRQDQCPDTAEDFDHFLDQDGCPELDNDEDGVADALDRCPEQPEDADGFQDGDGCPDPDNDLDGFLDAEDHCPADAEDFDGFKDLDGCPEPDNDADGIADAQDRCPNEPEDLNQVADEDGCPDQGAPADQTCARQADGTCIDADAPLPVDQRLTLSTPVRFELDSAELSVPVRAALDQLVQRLRQLPDDQRLKVVGHCDDLGSDEYNDRLSAQRAASVKDYLVSRGVDADRIDTVGFGRRQPLVNESSDEARAQNRRVELWVMRGRFRKAVTLSAN
jgi:outer membrane protein OmpA-like peptidoglycan-associated protein